MLQTIRQARADKEPITTAEAKTHLRVDHANDDTYIDALITAATDYTEEITGRSLVTKSFKQFMDCFPSSDSTAIQVDMPPLSSVTSIKYYDQADVEQTWTNTEYVVDTDQAYKSIIYPAITYSWPSPRVFPKAVTIEYVAGYADDSASPFASTAIPKPIIQAMLILIAHWYENREQVIVGSTIAMVPDAYDALIAPYKVRRF